MKEEMKTGQEDGDLGAGVPRNDTELPAGRRGPTERLRCQSTSSSAGAQRHPRWPPQASSVPRRRQLWTSPPRLAQENELLTCRLCRVKGIDIRTLTAKALEVLHALRTTLHNVTTHQTPRLLRENRRTRKVARDNSDTRW